MYFFVLIVNPVARPAGKPASKRQWPEKSIGLAVKVIINLSFSDTIFYLFALRKALPLNYFDQVNENEKIALAASAYTAWAPLSFAAWNTAAYPGVYFLPAPPSGLNDKTLKNNCAKMPPGASRWPYETLPPIR
ncbi:hypothetical protein I5Q27_16080 [Serratia marcescens]|nr:hypothetical protein [Serratia marcescens]